ncbi:hypothetical protein [Streptomyces sp. NPDC101234]|uniref:hypothetical protein n=1 Tax=Streptomyces sp. NPDC101234 TaxID=3366138 RepID=UPI0037FCAD8E
MHGDLDAQTVAPPGRALSEARAVPVRSAADHRGPEQLTFADCSILPPLCEAWSDCRVRDGRLRIVHDNRTTDLVFRCTGLLGRLPAQ